MQSGLASLLAEYLEAWIMASSSQLDRHCPSALHDLAGNLSCHHPEHQCSNWTLRPSPQQGLSSIQCDCVPERMIALWVRG